MSAVCLVPDCESPVRVKEKGWCNKHYRRWLRTGDPLKAAWERGNPEANFWAKVRKGHADECWPWTGALQQGYGHFVSTSGIMAHRFGYELLVGPIPEGLQLDHVCHTRDLNCNELDKCLHRRCVNPAHLEPVTQLENQRRRHDDRSNTACGVINRTKTQCPQGHPYDETNTYVDGKGSRNCRACAREKSRAHSQRPETKAKQRAYYLARRAKQKQQA